jgi:hypothetical protein
MEWVTNQTIKDKVICFLLYHHQNPDSLRAASKEIISLGDIDKHVRGYYMLIPLIAQKTSLICIRSKHAEKDQEETQQKRQPCKKGSRGERGETLTVRCQTTCTTSRRVNRTGDRRGGNRRRAGGDGGVWTWEQQEGKKRGEVRGGGGCLVGVGG